MPATTVNQDVAASSPDLQEGSSSAGNLPLFFVGPSKDADFHTVRQTDPLVQEDPLPLMFQIEGLRTQLLDLRGETLFL